jgi:hypothetical protein
MKLLKLGLRFWITLTSIFSFLVGWILLAHSPKPAASTNTSASPAVTPLPTLQPLQPLSGSDDSNFQNQQPSFNFVQPQQQFQFRNRPSFSTGGS